MYQTFFRLVFAKMDPEQAHHVAFRFIKSARYVRCLLGPFTRPKKQLRTHALGLTFASPFGLAAGFDKNAEAIEGLGALGFGHVEVGTLTRFAQAGNAKPRLFRLIADRALINRMGFNNNGSDAAVDGIERARLKSNRPIIGVNIGKSRVTKLEDAVSDYLYSAHRLAPIADYVVINVSSPNTPGLRSLQSHESLRPLLTEVHKAVEGTPLLVKIAPDLTDEEIDNIVDLVVEIGLDGIIATNTTISRTSLRTPLEVVESIGDGGLSGDPLRQRSLEVLRRIRQQSPANLCVISVGGVSSAEDVLERLDAGATLVQGYSAFVYEGPLWARRINTGLVKLGYQANLGAAS